LREKNPDSGMPPFSQISFCTKNTHFLLNLIFIHQEFGFSTLNLPCSFINAKHSGRQHLTDQTGIIALPYSTVNVRLGYRFHYYGNHCNPIDVTINKNLFAKTAAFRCPGFSLSIVYHETLQFINIQLYQVKSKLFELHDLQNVC
jgi:hypothetical protein